MQTRENIITISQDKNGKYNAKLNIPYSFLEKIGITPIKKGINVEYLKDKILVTPGMGKKVIFYETPQITAKISLRYALLKDLGYDLLNRKVIIFLDEDNQQLIIKGRNNTYLNILSFILNDIESSNLTEYFKIDSWEKTKILYYEITSKEEQNKTLSKLIEKLLELKG